jgi:hypothetical protein
MAMTATEINLCFKLSEFIKFIFAGKIRQCTYKITLRHVTATIVVVEKQQVLHIPSVCLEP